jgi:hypothetical protein
MAQQTVTGATSKRNRRVLAVEPASARVKLKIQIAPSVTRKALLTVPLEQTEKCCVDSNLCASVTARTEKQG